MRTIDNNIRAALISLLKNERGIGQELARLSGTSHSTWSRYAIPEGARNWVATMSEKNYEIVYPLIEKKLPATPRYWPLRRLFEFAENHYLHATDEDELLDLYRKASVAGRKAIIAAAAAAAKNEIDRQVSVLEASVKKGQEKRRGETSS